jgi:hypothetical protein
VTRDPGGTGTAVVDGDEEPSLASDDPDGWARSGSQEEGSQRHCSEAASTAGDRKGMKEPDWIHRMPDRWKDHYRQHRGHTEQAPA